MATNLAIEDALIVAAKDAGHHRTKREAVIAALEEYVRRRKQLELIELMGSIDYDPGYDYKALRNLR